MPRRKANTKRADVFVSRFLLLILLLLPAACAAPVSPVAVPQTTTENPAVNDNPDAPGPAGPQITLLPPRRPGPVALPGDNVLKPKRLIGMLDIDLIRLLGIPDFKRVDPPAQLWQYRNSSCLFDVFLFQDKNRANSYAVTYVEARGLDVNRVSDGDCYLSVLKNRN